jgi:hypothetical protein
MAMGVMEAIFSGFFLLVGVGTLIYTVWSFAEPVIDWVRDRIQK